MAAVNSFDKFNLRNKTDKGIVMKSNFIERNSHYLKQIKENFTDFIPKKYQNRLMGNCQRIRSFDPLSTLFCFLFQSLEGHSCKLALTSLNLIRIKHGLKTVSLNTSGYCRARKRLDEKVLKDLVSETGNQLETESSFWRWKDRSVKLVDGTTLTMSDSKENQKEYPQSDRQKKGLGWPMMRLVGIFSLSSGAITDFEIGKYSGKGQGEPSLLRRMINRLSPGDLLVLDRFFTGYFLHHDLLKQGVDVLVRIKDSVGKKYLKGNQKDLEVNIKRPQMRSILDRNTLPELPMRVIKSEVKRKGYRVKVIYLMTSLLDKKNYSRKELEKLYTRRWDVELDLRNLKITLGADQLQCKTPEMVRKELYVKLLAFNLIRKLIVSTCQVYRRARPRKYSFKTSLGAYVGLIKEVGIKSINKIIVMISNEIVNSKYRREARAIKRRKNTYPLLTKCRKEAKNEIWGYGRRRPGKGLLAI